MPFFTAIGHFIVNNWNDAEVKSVGKHALANFKKGNASLASLQLEDALAGGLDGTKRRFLSLQEKLLLVVSSAQRRGYKDAVEHCVQFKDDLSPNLPFATIVRAQLLLAASDSNKQAELFEKFGLNPPATFLKAASDEIKKVSDKEKQTWPYQITVLEIELRELQSQETKSLKDFYDKIDLVDNFILKLEFLRDAVEKNDASLEIKKVPQEAWEKWPEENYLFSTKLLLAKAYLLKAKELKTQMTDSNELDDIRNKLSTFLDESFEKIRAESHEVPPALAALRCEFDIIFPPYKLDYELDYEPVWQHAQQALKQHEIYNNQPYHQDYLLDDVTFNRMRGIVQLSNEMTLLKKKELELQLKTGIKEQKAHRALQSINQRLNDNIFGMLRGSKLSTNAFTTALDYTQLEKDGHPLITTDYKHIIKNIVLAVVLLGFFYAIAGAVHKAKTGKFTFYDKVEAKEELDKVKTAARNMAPKKSK